MVDLEQLRKRINNRPVIIMLHGKSIEGLENTITDLKDLDICYTSVNYFDVMEDFILSKIDKQLDFIYDSASIVPQNVQLYESRFRIPRLRKYLDKDKNNIWITTEGIMRIIMVDCNYDDFIMQYEKQIMLVDKLNINLSVPNSSVLLIGISILGGAKKIAICGMDGYVGLPHNNIHSYYKKDLYLKHRDAATATRPSGFVKDVPVFDRDVRLLLNDYVVRFNMALPPMVNCSPNSIYGAFEKISYNKLKEWITKE